MLALDTFISKYPAISRSFPSIIILNLSSKKLYFFGTYNPQTKKAFHKIRIFNTIILIIRIFLQRHMVVKTLSSTQAQKSFGELVIKAIREPISITKHAKEIFVIVPSVEYHKMNSAYESAYKNLSLSNKTASSYIGSARGLFSSAKDVDTFISQERELWQ